VVRCQLLFIPAHSVSTPNERWRRLALPVAYSLNVLERLSEKVPEQPSERG
jgi:hypothetical protein